MNEPEVGGKVLACDSALDVRQAAAFYDVQLRPSLRSRQKPSSQVQYTSAMQSRLAASSPRFASSNPT